MDHSYFIVCIVMGNSIGLKRVNHHATISNRDQPSLYSIPKSNKCNKGNNCPDTSHLSRALARVSCNQLQRNEKPFCQETLFLFYSLFH